MWTVPDVFRRRRRISVRLFSPYDEIISQPRNEGGQSPGDPEMSRAPRFSTKNHVLTFVWVAFALFASQTEFQEENKGIIMERLGET